MSEAVALITRGYFVSAKSEQGSLAVWAVCYRRTTNGARASAGYVTRDASGRRAAYTDAGRDLAPGSEPWRRRMEAVEKYEDAVKAA